MSAPSELNARQRKHVHMHSSIFSSEGPTSKSVYVPSRQQELYENLKGTLKEYNYKPPEISMPSAGDMKCTQNAGSGVVLPSGGQGQEFSQSTPRTQRTTTRDVLVHEGEARHVVRHAGKDEAIPKEFWSTSVNLQWHDTRNEQCRMKPSGPPAQTADAMKRHQLSSEVFGKDRLMNASTVNPRADLLAEPVDHLRMDSQLAVKGGGEGQSPNARARFERNLSKSVHNPMQASGMQAQDRPQDVKNEDPSGSDRRRTEKNFSDIFGARMGERKDIRGNREEILASRNCHFLDSRTEVATRNKTGWKHDGSVTAADRKVEETASSLFDRPAPQRPSMDPTDVRQNHSERTCWDSKEVMQASSEIARRRRQKDHLKDFADLEGHTHLSRKQDIMSSNQVGFSITGAPTQAWATSPRGPAGPPRSPVAAGERSAKDTKLASLQSTLFS